MMPPLPPELAAAPPRDPAAAPHLFARGPNLVVLALVALFGLPLVVVGGALLLAGPDATALLTALGLSGVVGLALAAAAFGLGMQRSRARRLFREGLVTTGRIAGVRRAPKGGWVFVDVEYGDGRGGRFVGSAAANRNTGTVDLSVGQEVPVLYLPHDVRLFAVFSRSLGLVAGVAKK